MWIPDDQHGYSLAICECEGGPYLGARRMGSPCCCEKCGFITADQWDFLLAHLAGTLDAAKADALDEAADALAAIFADPERSRPRRRDAEFATDLANDAEWAEQILRDRAAAIRADGLLDDYDPVPGLVARGVMSDEHDPNSCELACCNESRAGDSR